ncbi:transposase, partial [Acidiphilium multivorum]
IVQTCIVHLLRNSMDFVSYKDHKAVATALKDIYRTGPLMPKPPRQLSPPSTPVHGGQKYPDIGQSWRRVWQEVIPFFSFPG